MTLYEINKEIENALADIYNSMDAETGEVDESYVHALEELNIQKEEKLDNLGAYIKNLQAEAVMLKNEEQALKARREAKEKKVESLKNYIASILNGEKFESARVAFSFRKSDEVSIVDETLIPEEYMKIKTESEPDKTAIKKALKSGLEVRGAFLIDKNNLQVK